MAPLVAGGGPRGSERLARAVGWPIDMGNREEEEGARGREKERRRRGRRVGSAIGNEVRHGGVNRV